MPIVSEWLSKHSNLASLVPESIVLIKCCNPLPLNLMVLLLMLVI